MSIISLIQHLDATTLRVDTTPADIGDIGDGLKMLRVSPVALVQIGGTENLMLSEYGAAPSERDDAKYEMTLAVNDTAARKLADLEEFVRATGAKNAALQEYAKSKELPLKFAPLLKLGNRIKVIMKNGTAQLAEIDDEGKRHKGATFEVFNPGCEAFVIVQISGIYVMTLKNEEVRYGITLSARYAAAKKYAGEEPYVAQGLDFDDLVVEE